MIEIIKLSGKMAAIERAGSCDLMYGDGSCGEMALNKFVFILGTGAYNPLEMLPTRLGLSIRTADTAMSNPTGTVQSTVPINIMGPSTLAPPLPHPDTDQDSDSKSGGRPVMGYEPQPGTSRNFHSFLNFLSNVKSESNQGKKLLHCILLRSS